MWHPLLKKDYQELQRILNQILHNLNVDTASVVSDFSLVEEIWQRINVNLNENEEMRETISQPVQTEIHRLMRLLLMDGQFLKVVRPGETKNKRILGMSDRIKTLLKFLSLIIN
ncbi:MAG TPA: heterocyst frequency control protein PatD [Allocoleopsis sp.]